MFKQFYRWYQQRFTDPNLGVLFLIVIFAFAAFYWLGSILVPLFVAIVLSYLLDRPVTFLTRYKVSRGIATLIVMSLFILLCIFALVGILPILFKQAVAFIHDLPFMLNTGNDYLMRLPSTHPEMVDAAWIRNALDHAGRYLLNSGGLLVSYSFASLLNLAALIVYAILVPLMMIFLLKDKVFLMQGVSQYVPKNRKLVVQVWNEMDVQILNYIRGKIIEILIVGISTYCVFFLVGLHYGVLLAVLVGISVLIPYVGAVVVSVPVILIGLYQWGLNASFGYMIISYLIVQAIDGNVIVPLIFSEAVSLPPVIIIVAVLIFGGLWGFWGVFFAIPLASLVKAILNAWPKNTVVDIA